MANKKQSYQKKRVRAAQFWDNAVAVLDGSKEAQDASFAIRKLLHLPAHMPLWLNLIFTTIKPIVMTSIFGLPDANAAKPKPSSIYLIAPFFVMLTLAAFASDVRLIVSVLCNDALSEWQRLCAMVICVSISSNCQTAFSSVTLLLNYVASQRGRIGKALRHMALL